KRNRLQLLLFATALTLAVLSSLEIAFRFFTPQAEQAPSDQYIRFLRENARPFFKIVSTDHGAELVQMPTVWESVLGQRFRLQKPPQVRRILVVGESNAQLLGRELRDAVAGSPVSDRF